MSEKAKPRPSQRPRTVSLNREHAVYEANLPRWIPDYEGQHVLIKGKEVAGFYKTREDALAAGYSRFGVSPLFVKQVAASEPVYHIPNAFI